MSITAYSGPLVVFGQAPSYDYNPEAGPSLFYGGMGILDPRSAYTYEPGQDFGNVTAGFLGVNHIITINYAPATKAAAGIAALANVTSGTAMTLVSSSGSGVTVGVSTINAATGQTVTGLLALGGGAAQRVSFGSSGTVQLWNPATLLSRAVSITGSTSGTGGDFLVSGYDVYGYPMTETITCGAGANTVNGAKAFKYIASVVPQFTDAHNYSVGTTDIFGFPIYSATWNGGAVADVSISWNGAVITSTTGYTAGVTTTATATTGDVRGTYAVQSASDGTKKLIITQSPTLANIASATGLFGVTQA
jgi:hypothetical protein